MVFHIIYRSVTSTRYSPSNAATVLSTTSCILALALIPYSCLLGIPARVLLRLHTQSGCPSSQMADVRLWEHPLDLLANLGLAKYVNATCA